MQIEFFFTCRGCGFNSAKVMAELCAWCGFLAVPAKG